MAGNYSIGTAYLKVVPQLDDGTKNQLSSALGGNVGKQAGTEIGSGLKTAVGPFAVAAGTLIADAVKAGAQAGADAITQLIGGAFEGFGRFEQLQGGVEKIFGADAQRVLEDASNAFLTAGISANQYMEQVTGFSSSLLQSLGGDTEEAARISNMALIDMADNANTFGSDMQAIQNAYQGFAKQNYTMLDNLKLGYGGTKTEMERLLADAQALSGVEYDISNLADVYEAIHVIQTEMGVTGKTAEEALSTVEGSVGALNAAWQNWLTELGKPNADVNKVTEQLIGAFDAAAQNVVPAMGRIIAAIVRGFPQLLSQLGASLPGIITDFVSEIFGEGVANGMVDGVDAITGALEPLWQALEPIVQAVYELGAFVAANVVPVVAQIVGSGLLDFLSGVIEGVAGTISVITNLVGLLAGGLVGAWNAVSTAVSTVQSVMTTAADVAQVAWQTFVDFMASIPDQILGFFSGIGEKIVGLFRGLSFPTLHLEGSLNPVDWVTQGLPTIKWYASGAIFNRATVLSGFGEAGAEAAVPLNRQGLMPFKEVISDVLGGTTNIYIDGARVNADEDVENLFYEFMQELLRLGTMTGGARVGYAV